MNSGELGLFWLLWAQVQWTYFLHIYAQMLYIYIYICPSKWEQCGLCLTGNNQIYSVIYANNMKCGLWGMCSVFLVTWLMLVSHTGHTYAHMSYMWTVVGRWCFWLNRMHYFNSADISAELKWSHYQVVVSIVKYVHSAHHHMADCSDFICAWDICIHHPYKSIRYLAYMVYMPNLVCIFVSSIYLAITWEVCIAVGCVVAHACRNVCSLCPFNILVVRPAYTIWQSYLFSNICLHRALALYTQLLHSSALYVIFLCILM